MQNPYGAKITHSVDNAMQQFLVVFDRSKSLESRQYDAHLCTQYGEEVFFIDQNFHYLFTIANQQQAEQLKKLQSVKQVGGIHIDIERFHQVITGNF